MSAFCGDIAASDPQISSRVFSILSNTVDVDLLRSIIVKAFKIFVYFIEHTCFDDLCAFQRLSDVTAKS